MWWMATNQKIRETRTGWHVLCGPCCGCYTNIENLEKSTLAPATVGAAVHTVQTLTVLPLQDHVCSRLPHTEALTDTCQENTRALGLCRRASGLCRRASKGGCIVLMCVPGALLSLLKLKAGTTGTRYLSLGMVLLPVS